MGVAHLSSFAQATNVRESARLRFEPTRKGVISWNTYAPEGRLRFRLLRALTPASAWYDFVEWHPSGRKSFSAASEVSPETNELVGAATEARFTAPESCAES